MARLPNFLIHLSAFIRPSRLRPDIRVPHIGYVDFQALRKEGFNAVVVDKDNCVTLPERDEVYPPFQSAWDDLLATFPPGRVLVVSNSAGTPKDPSGIAAESVSLNLRAPVLVRQTPKPGCAPEIISYFRGTLGRPTTLRGTIHRDIQHMKDVEMEDEKELMGRWLSKMDREPLLGRSNDSSSKSKPLESRMEDEQAGTARSSPETLEVMEEKKDAAELAAPEVDALRILVIGDRLFTDTLLAHRLSRLLPSSDIHTPSILSIHTTTLPQPNDVRPLRWLEDKLSKGRLKEGKVDWGRYTRNPYAGVPSLEEIESVPRLTLKDRWNDLRQDVKESRLRWDPRTWRAFDLAVGLGRGIYWVEERSWRLLRRGTGALWTRIQQQRQQRSQSVVTPDPVAPGPSVKPESLP